MSELSPAARAVLDRYRQKTHMAGGPQPGYALRRWAIAAGLETVPAMALAAALAELTAAGLLKPNEAGDRYALSAAGAQWLHALASRPGGAP